jgi:predicted NBD/HSP70 family sugar kinase
VPRQLIDHASIFLLERRLAEAEIDPAAIWDPGTDWATFGPALDDWIEHTARHLAIGVVAVSAVIDFERILIEANCPPDVRRRVVERTRVAVAGLDTQGIGAPVIAEASVGRNARAIGAAALPILDRYLLSQPRFG